MKCSVWRSKSNKTPTVLPVEIPPSTRRSWIELCWNHERCLSMYIANPLSSLPGEWWNFNLKLSVWLVTKSGDLWCHNIKRESLRYGFLFSFNGKKKKNIFTKHFISTDINARDAKSGISICTIFINRELPIMNSPRESHGAERNTMFPPVSGHHSVVIHEV